MEKSGSGINIPDPQLCFKVSYNDSGASLLVPPSLKEVNFFTQRVWINTELSTVPHLELSRFGVHGSGLEDVQRLRHCGGDGPLQTDRINKVKNNSI